MAAVLHWMLCICRVIMGLLCIQTLKAKTMSFKSTLCYLLALIMTTEVTEARDITCEQYEMWNVSHFQCVYDMYIVYSDGSSETQCFPEYYVCDSIIDCHDATDELANCQTAWTDQCNTDYANKTTADGNPLQKLQCTNGQCVLGCRRCDGKFDCVDNSDEIGCGVSNITIPPCN